jgi:hypothetical protein
MRLVRWCLVVLLLLFAWQVASAFQSDELSEDDDEWGIVGGSPAQKAPEKLRSVPVKSSSDGVIGGSSTGTADRFRSRSTPSTDKKVQFTLEHSFGGGQFSPAGTVTARVRDSAKGGQVRGLII